MGGQKIMSNEVGRVTTSRTSRGAHVRALYAALQEILSIRLSEAARTGGEAHLRDHIAALERAYPMYLRVTPSDIEQLVKELDDEPFEDVP